MKKKRAKKRIAKRRPITKAKRRRAVAAALNNSTSVEIRLPANVLGFLRGASTGASMPIDTIINALLAVQVHAMREKT